MQFAYAKSFYKTIENISSSLARKLLKAVKKFESSWESGEFPKGTGLTHLKGNFFEFRVDIHRRILFQKKENMIYYLLFGSHDDIRRFLKRL